MIEIGPNLAGAVILACVFGGFVVLFHALLGDWTE